MKHYEKHIIPKIAAEASWSIVKKKYVVTNASLDIDLDIYRVKIAHATCLLPKSNELVVAIKERAKRKKVSHVMYAARRKSVNSCSISLSPKAMQAAINGMEIEHKIPALVATSFSKFSKASKHAW